MSLALVQSRALLGLQAPAVTVEVHLANGLPSFTLVGLADTEVKEARERASGVAACAAKASPARLSSRLMLCRDAPSMCPTSSCEKRSVNASA